MITFTAVGSGLNEAEILGLVSLISLVGSVLGTMVFKPTPETTLREFYDSIRPNGWWPREWKDGHRDELRRNWVDLVAAVVWQVTTFMIPMFLVLNRWGAAFILVVPWVLAFRLLVRKAPEPVTV